MEDTCASNLNLSVEDDEVRIVSESQPTASTKKRSRSQTSEVWDSFEKIGIKDGKEKCICKVCKTELVCPSSSGTSHLIRHKNKCQRDLNKHGNVGKMLQEVEEKSRAKKLDQKYFRGLVAQAVIQHDLPFSYCEMDGVRKTWHALNPDVKYFTRNTLV